MEPSVLRGGEQGGDEGDVEAGGGSGNRRERMLLQSAEERYEVRESLCLRKLGLMA